MLHDEELTPLHFESYVTYAINSLVPEKHILMEFHKTQRVTPRNRGTSKKVQKFDHTSETPSNIEIKNIHESSSNITDSTAYRIVTEYDSQNNLVALRFEGNVPIPREVLKVIGFVIPFHRQLTSIAFKGLAYYTLHEIRNFQLKHPMLTEIYIDNSNFLNTNICQFIDDPTNIKCLSFTNCQITDEMLEKIISLLKNGQAAKSLTHLNLSWNKITDIGASYIAEMLRINRTLLYLNISANNVTDEGVKSILDVLQIFLVRPDELYLKKQEYFEYLIQQAQIEQKQAFTIQSDTTVYKAIGKSLKSVKSAVEFKRLEFSHVFHGDNVYTVDNKTYCLGNNVLCALNLSYNNLTMMTLTNIIEVIQYQMNSTKIPGGLLYLNIEGNLLPKFCNELTRIDNLLDTQIQKIHDRQKSLLSVSKKRSRGPN